MRNLNSMHYFILAVSALAPLATALTAADSAVIIDSGSTNTPGFRIEVSTSGEAVYIPKPRRAGQLSEAQAKPKNRKLPAAMVKPFFAALDAAKPLSSLPGGGCFKSASFGTTRVIEYHGQTTPDLSCGDRGDLKRKALIQSMAEIVKFCSSD